MKSIQSMYDTLIGEHFDIEDTQTRKILLSIDEADQNQVLMSLTSKLYESIIDKVDEIDFGEIPETKGDITKLSNYDKLKESLDIMDKLITELKQDNAPVRTIQNAITNIEMRKSQFERGFKLKLELPMLIYNTIVLSIISATSYLIATIIEFIKSPGDETLSIALNKVALVRSKEHTLFRNLEKFNNVCSNGDLDKSLDFVIQKNVKNFAGTGTSVVVISAAIIAILISIIPIIRELIFLLYYTRARLSNYFDIQADMLQLNASNLEAAATNKNDEKKKIASKQLAVAKSFRSIANAVAIKSKQAETTTSKELINDSKKYKIADVVDNMPDSASSGSLF